MLLAHQIELKPNNKQATHFAKACGVARFAYNWALDQWKKQYEDGGKPSESALRKQLNSIKKSEYPWMLEVTKNSPQQAIKDLGDAFSRFFKKTSGYPKFKKKGVRDSFRADNGTDATTPNAVKVLAKKVKVPNLGWVNMTEEVRFQGQIKSLVISRKADRWFASFTIDTEQLPHVRKNHGAVGIDLGIKSLATFSKGESYTGVKAHTQKLSRLKRLSRQLSRKKKGSNNFKKASMKLAKLHLQISNLRKDYLHKTTTETVLNYDQIGLEDLNVKGMSANRKLARHILDQSFYEFKRQLEYKSQMYDSKITVADRFFPSSKLCHVCNWKNDNLTLSVREWTCPQCNTLHDRDYNAAKNLELLCTVSSTETQACGVESSGLSALISETMPCRSKNITSCTTLDNNG